MNNRCLALAAAFLLLPAPLLAKTIDVAPGPDAQERLQSALIDAKPGDIVKLGAGRFVLTDGLSLDVNGVTVRGAGRDATVLDFKGQKASGEGLRVSSDDVVLRDFAVEDAKGDAIKSKGADRIVYYNLRVEWTGGPKETNGAYGIYPVSSEHVLIDNVIVRGASDAGIYVGQSRRIIVRNSRAEFNVAGIEIENSYEAEVHNNVATRNTGGILVFDLPDLPQMGGRSIRIFNNRIVDNDTPNFAPKGNIVASVPDGTGVIVMANRDVHVFGNEIGGNGTTNILVTGYARPFTDKNYQPLVERVLIGDNRHGRAGFAPGPQFPGARELGAAFGGLPSIVWDGTGRDVVVRDQVAILSLNLTDPLRRDLARPSLVKPMPVVPTPPAAARALLPASMEAAIR